MMTTTEEQWKEEWAKPITDDRLPHLSEFHATYDATSTTWTVCLNTTVDGKPESFSLQARGIFPALMRLDRLYRTRAGLPSRKGNKRSKNKVKKRSGQL